MNYADYRQEKSATNFVIINNIYIYFINNPYGGKMNSKNPFSLATFFFRWKTYKFYPRRTKISGFQPDPFERGAQYLPGLRRTPEPSMVKSSAPLRYTPGTRPTLHRTIMLSN